MVNLNDDKKEYRRARAAAEVEARRLNRVLFLWLETATSDYAVLDIGPQVSIQGYLFCGVVKPTGFRAWWSSLCASLRAEFGDVWGER